MITGFLDHCDSPFIDTFIQKIQRQRTGALRYNFYNIVNSLINISVALVFNFSFACLDAWCITIIYVGRLLQPHCWSICYHLFVHKLLIAFLVNSWKESVESQHSNNIELYFFLGLHRFTMLLVLYVIWSNLSYLWS